MLAARDQTAAVPGGPRFPDNQASASRANVFPGYISHLPAAGEIGCSDRSGTTARA